MNRGSCSPKQVLPDVLEVEGGLEHLPQRRRGRAGVLVVAVAEGAPVPQRGEEHLDADQEVLQACECGRKEGGRGTQRQCTGTEEQRRVSEHTRAPRYQGPFVAADESAAGPHLWRQTRGHRSSSWGLGSATAKDKAQPRESEW